jgi:hypothetical protein
MTQIARTPTPTPDLRLPFLSSKLPNNTPAHRAGTTRESGTCSLDHTREYFLVTFLKKVEKSSGLGNRWF